MAKEIAAGTGRRKTAVARVRLLPGDGKWLVNDVAIEEYIHSEALRQYLNQPLVLTGLTGKFDVVISAKGGGISGQSGAIRRDGVRMFLLFQERDG